MSDLLVQDIVMAFLLLALWGIFGVLYVQRFSSWMAVGTTLIFGVLFWGVRLFLR